MEAVEHLTVYGRRRRNPKDKDLCLISVRNHAKKSRTILVLIYYYIVQACKAVASETDAQKNKNCQYWCGLLLCVACSIPFVVLKNISLN